MKYNAAVRTPSNPKLEDIQDVDELQLLTERLWGLLDDIDTASDMFKPSDLDSYKAFYVYAMNRASIRHNHLVSDGYDLFRSHKI